MADEIDWRGGDSLEAAIFCCDSWVPEARLIGNVRAITLGNLLRELATLKAVPVDADDARLVAYLRSITSLLAGVAALTAQNAANRIEHLARAYAAQSAELAECIKQIREETQRDDPTTLFEWVKAMRLEVNAEFESRAAAEKELDETKELFSKRNKQLREAVVDLLASAHPHPVEHPTMAAAWARATGTLGTIGHDEVTGARTLQSELAATKSELNEIKTAWEASAEAARVEREGYFESLRAAGVALDESISAHVSTRRELAELHRALGSVMRAAEQGDRMIGDADKKPNYAASYDYLRQSIRLNLSTLVKASKAGTDGQR